MGRSVGDPWAGSLRSVTAGIYIGEKEGVQRTKVGALGLINDRLSDFVTANARKLNDAIADARRTLLDAGAEVTATVGTSEVAMASVTIRDAATDISVQANPASVPRAGGTVTLTAFVTNSQGQGFQGAPVTFESERGSLQNTGVVFTNTSGVATNTLTLTQEQLEGVPPNGTFTVTATTPLGTGDLISDSTVIRVE